MRLRLPVLVAASLLIAWAGVASAQDDKPDYEAAKQHYIKATQAIDQGDYAIAAREFGLAYQITKDPVLFYKIAESHDKAGDCESALIYYGRYLREAKPSEKDKATAEDNVKTCKEKLGQTDDGGGAGDGGGGGGDGGGGGGDIIAPDLDDTPPGDDGKRQPTFLDEGTSWQRTAAWVSVGFAVAAGTTGAVLALSANSREEDINTLIDFRDPVTDQPRRFEGQIQRQYEDFIDEGKDLKTYSQIAWIAAGVGVAAAVTFFIWDPGSPGGSGESAQGPTITPVVTPDGAAVNAGWRF